MQTGVHTYQDLRKKHPRLIYQSFAYTIEDNQLQIKWRFLLEPDISFEPTLTIPLQESEKEKCESPENQTILSQLIFHIGMVELISYWKAACPPEIVIEAGTLNEQQVSWWQTILIRGLGEFFYTNQIDFTEENFVTFITSKQETSLPDTSPLEGKNIIIPLGGGKDSTVALEILKTFSDHAVQPWSLNPIPAAEATSLKAGFSNLRVSDRTIDPTLLELNQAGYLNGHTPFSAYLAFYYALVGWLTNTKYIALSNESSANECNAIYKGHEINHQYSKTFEFEQLFREYSKTYLLTELEYFSFLRPLHELQIAKLFAKFPDHFQIFRSCNRGQKTNSWCHECPKCLFAFLMLFPFIDTQILTTEIFHHNLFENQALLDIALKLVKSDETKPFECVGSYEESKIAFYLALQQYQQQNIPLPPMLEFIWDRVLKHEQNLDQRASVVLADWNDQHNLTPEFTRTLQSFLNQS